ncbi:uncharacterized protein MYCGRDRAFT_96643 [Zymoseptoria tritici IPO323]|uniref:Uncharacterized protein n=1 Tax=Zymoseptoria tritici (strain CBS 115943 / IPO323) TaxID=336722 RepID=F9XN17_ZYMTI|nr:uncharacterized protein MYCGRDRAFT_96643 [Zymoseptoria tritici IPO323]EGP83592.1 hypothetical protein MYCGRDRAFT_96643 [Zymoseptoria tritici IPO323]
MLRNNNDTATAEDDVKHSNTGAKTAVAHKKWVERRNKAMRKAQQNGTGSLQPAKTLGPVQSSPTRTPSHPYATPASTAHSSRTTQQVPRGVVFTNDQPFIEAGARADTVFEGMVQDAMAAVVMQMYQCELMQLPPPQITSKDSLYDDIYDELTEYSIYPKASRPKSRIVPAHSPPP